MKGGRCRTRLKHKLEVWRVAVGMIAVINGLDQGKVYSPSSTVAGFDADPSVAAAQRRAFTSLLSDAAVFARERRKSFRQASSQGPSEGPGTAALLLTKGAETQDGYVRLARKAPQVPLCAAAVDEPSTDVVVDMLCALPPDEAQFYETESNVVELTAKSSIITAELEARYGFVGGSRDEYIEYFHRPDLPNNMWTWDLWARARTATGFSSVPKKNPTRQRKLLISVATNYLWCDPKGRSNVGMSGGNAITSLHTNGHAIAIAACSVDVAVVQRATTACGVRVGCAT